MSGYNIIVADLLHAVKHFIKFQISVTVDTWIRGAAVFVGIYKPVHNLCMEICGKIKHVVRHIHLIGYASGILNIVQGTAGLFPVDTDIFVVVKFHGSADALVTGFLCQKSCHGAVYTAAHCYDRFFHLYLNLSLMIFFTQQKYRISHPHSCNFAFIIIWQISFVHDFSPGTFALLLSRRLSLVYNRTYFSEKDVTI